KLSGLVVLACAAIAFVGTDVVRRRRMTRAAVAVCAAIACFAALYAGLWSPRGPTPAAAGAMSQARWPDTLAASSASAAFSGLPIQPGIDAVRRGLAGSQALPVMPQVQAN